MIKKIKVLVVDDSIVFRSMMGTILSRDPDLELVGTAADAFEAKDKIIKLNPDVMTLDIEMPKMNGLDFLRKVLPLKPLPVIVVSSTPVRAFEAISAGAVDLIKKPERADMNEFAIELIQKIHVAAEAKVLAGAATAQIKTVAPSLIRVFDSSRVNGRIIALGASTGGTEALLEVVKDFPRTTPGVVIVQHMPAGFTKMYADRLNRICKMEVREVKNGDRVQQGLILIGAGDFQMRVRKDATGYYVSSQKGDKVSGHCPSVDVLFDSVAEAAGPKAVGAILTGMGSDGAEGLLKMKQAGAYTIGQDKETCIVYGMPMAAFNRGAVMRQAPLGSIAGIILDRFIK
jgi:two-component system chemotaxis response regulator CheB